MKNPHRIKLISPVTVIGLALILSGVVGTVSFWISKNYGMGKFHDELEWYQYNLYNDCGDLCNCNPPWYMSNLWMLEMQYRTFGSIPIEVCNEEVDEAIEEWCGEWEPEWRECNDTLGDCTLDLSRCGWALEKCMQDCDLKKVEEILEAKE